jgi:hypothetical protein
MNMIYLIITGFVLAGYCLPEIAILLGSGKLAAPLALNLMCALCAGLISTGLLFAV